MKKRVFLLATALVCAIGSNAQLRENTIGTQTWEEITSRIVYDGTNAAGASLIHAGFNYDAGITNFNALLTSTSPTAALINWQLVTATPTSTHDFRLNSVITCANGDYVAVGWTNTAAGTYKAFIVRVSSAGAVIWTNELLSTAFYDSHFFDVTELANGDLAAVGNYFANTASLCGRTATALVVSFNGVTGAMNWSEDFSQSTFGPMFTAVTCTPTMIICAGNADYTGSGACGTAFSAVITRLNYGGGHLGTNFYAVNYTKVNGTVTINGIWANKIVLRSNILSLSLALTNMGAAGGDDGGILTVDANTFAPIHLFRISTTNPWTNFQGYAFSVVNVLANDFTFVIAPGASRFNLGVPTIAPISPVICRINGTTPIFNNKIPSPTGQFCMDLNLTGAPNMLYTSGFIDPGAFGNRDIYDISSDFAFTNTTHCPLSKSPIIVDTVFDSTGVLHWNPNPTDLNPNITTVITTNTLNDIHSCGVPKYASTTGVNNINANTAPGPISIYPNPSTGIVNIESKNDAISQVQVFDLTGKLLLNYNGINGNKTSVSLDNFAAGSYIIRVNGSFSQIVNKIE